MTQQNIPLDLAFQLSGEGVEITYLTSGQDGKPHFTYKDAEYNLNHAGDKIRHQQSELGTLVTTTLLYGMPPPESLDLCAILRLCQCSSVDRARASGA